MTLKNQIRTDDEALISLDKVQDNPICPTCLQNLSSEQRSRLVTDLEMKKQTLQNEMKNAESKERDLHQALLLLDQLTEKNAELQKRAAQLEHLNGDLAENERQLSEVSKKIKEIKDDVAGEELFDLQQDLENHQEALRMLETKYALFKRQQLEIQRADREISMTCHNRLFSEWITEALDMTIKSIMGVPLRQVEKGIYDCMGKFDLLRGQDASLDLEKTQMLPDMVNRSFHSLSGSEKGILYRARFRLHPGHCSCPQHGHPAREKSWRGLERGGGQ